MQVQVNKQIALNIFVNQKVLKCWSSEQDKS